MDDSDDESEVINLMFSLIPENPDLSDYEDDIDNYPGDDSEASIQPEKKQRLMPKSTEEEKSSQNVSGLGEKTSAKVDKSLVNFYGNNFNNLSHFR